MTNGSHIPQDDLALYSMRALAPDDAEFVRVHVSECPECRNALKEIAGDIALVSMSVEQRPLPPGARQRFLDRVHLDSTAHQETATARNHSVVINQLPRRLRWPTVVTWCSVAALILVAVALQIRIHFLTGQLRQQAELLSQQKAESARAQAVLDLLTSPEAQHVMLTSTKAQPLPSARAVYLPAKGSLLLQASSLEPIPPGKTYELWLIPSSGAPIPAGLFAPDANGNARVVLPHLPEGIQAKAFGITVENSGGSSTPTPPIVLQGAPPSPGE